jgi:hypothetical protein
MTYNKLPLPPADVNSRQASINTMNKNAAALSDITNPKTGGAVGMQIKGGVTTQNTLSDIEFMNAKGGQLSKYDKIGGSRKQRKSRKSRRNRKSKKYRKKSRR